MATKTKAAIRTQLDAVAAAMTLAMADTVTGIATPFKSPADPVRNIHKLLVISGTGVVSVDPIAWDALWNAAGTSYLGRTQNIPNGNITNKVL